MGQDLTVTITVMKDHPKKIFMTRSFKIERHTTFIQVLSYLRNELQIQIIDIDFGNVVIRLQNKEFLTDMNLPIYRCSNGITLNLQIIITQHTKEITSLLEAANNQLNGNTPIKIKLTSIGIAQECDIDLKDIAKAADSYNDIKDKIMENLISNNMINKQDKDRNITLSANGKHITSNIPFSSYVDHITKQIHLTQEFTYRGG